MDDSPELQGKTLNGYLVIGTINQASKYMDSEYVCAIGSAQTRREIVRRLEQTHPSIRFATLIDPSVEDIDVFETHDCFTSSEYAAISCFGLSEPGREYEMIESGILRFDGKKTMNPSGGLIGCGHPVGASGARMLLDCYKQTAGLAEGYQVENVRNAAMLNFGGSATTNYVYIVGI